MEKLLNSFINVNDMSFNDFFEKHKMKHLENREDYIELKKCKKEIYEKYPELQRFVEDNKCINFNEELLEAFNKLVYIYSCMDKLELKEAYKLGARDCYVFLVDTDMRPI